MLEFIDIYYISVFIIISIFCSSLNLLLLIENTQLQAIPNIFLIFTILGLRLSVYNNFRNKLIDIVSIGSIYIKKVRNILLNDKMEVLEKKKKIEKKEN